MRLAAAVLVAVGDVVADDARIVSRRRSCSGRLTSMPKPFMKPWSRSTSTVGWFGVQVEQGDLGVARPCRRACALAHSPISSPALKLSVAKVASAASIGSSGVSSAITRMPASRAFLTVGTMALVSLGVIRMPLAPSAIRLSIAATWPSLSPSSCRRRPELDAEFLGLGPAPSFILTKKGLVSVLVMRPTSTSSAEAEATPMNANATAPAAILAKKILPKGHVFLPLVFSNETHASLPGPLPETLRMWRRD